MKKGLCMLFIILAFAIGYFISKPPNMTEDKVSPNPNFKMSSNLNCQILQSSSKDDIGKKISINNLNTDEPSVTFDWGDSPMRKVFNDEYTLVIQLIASGTGSVDTLIIDKTSGVFARISGGNAFGVYSIASKGNCR